MPFFPEQTARDEEINGVTVRVQTLNKVAITAIRNAANNAAALAWLEYKTGSPLWNAYVEDLSRQGREAQETFLIEDYVNGGTPLGEAANKFPVPMEPERADETEAEFAKRVETYEAAKQKCVEDRTKCAEKLIKDFAAKAKKMTDPVLLKQCMEAFRLTVFNSAFLETLKIHRIWWAVRCADDHGKKFYSSPEKVADLPDELIQYYQKVYVELDNITPEQVPTSPVKS